MSFDSPLGLLVGAIPFVTLPYVSFRCEEKVKVGVNTPAGVGGTVEVCVKKEAKTGDIQAQIPPGAVRQTVTVGTCSFTIPANPSDQPVDFKATWTDPIIAQVPIGWTVASASVTTPLGSGPAIVTPGPIPYDAIVTPGNVAIPTAFYAAEPGMQILMFDYPPGLEAPGPSEATVVFSTPPGPFGLVVLKSISAGKLEITPLFGPPLFVYPPQDPLGVTDFAVVTSDAHTILADGLDGTDCPGPPGVAPDMILDPANWHIGAPGVLGAGGFPPGLPVVFYGSLSDQLPPIVPAPFWFGGCKLRLDPTSLIGPIPSGSNGAGDALVPFFVPPDPLLIGLSTAWQAISFDPGTLEFLATHHMKARVEAP